MRNQFSDQNGAGNQPDEKKSQTEYLQIMKWFPGGLEEVADNCDHKNGRKQLEN